MRILATGLYFLAVGLSPVAASDLPTLDEAFGPGRAGSAGLARGDLLLRIDVPSRRYPDARCADGTPVPIYVRRASDRQHRDDWVVYLQGGGGCDDGQNCFERWQGRDGNFGANKLSSRFAPTHGIGGGGIHSRDPRNPFAGWNHVYVYYCSSDGWSGQVRDRATMARVGDDQVEVAYRLNFLGARIIDAVFDMLHRGAGPLRYRDARGLWTLPNMADARTVLFAGSSAGGGGVIRNADRVGEMIGACQDEDTRCAPRFAAVVDGSIGLARESLDHAGSNACGSEAVDTCSYASSMQMRWQQVVRRFWDGVTDASCHAHHTARGEQWRCADGVHIVEHHLATPLFVRSDLQDRLVLRNTLQAGFGYQGVPLDRELYGRLLELQLVTLPERREGIDPPWRPVGIFATQCGEHVGLDSNPASFRHAVEVDGRRQTFLATLANWLAGRPPSIAIQSFEPGGPPRGCGLQR